MNLDPKLKQQRLIDFSDDLKAIIKRNHTILHHIIIPLLFSERFDWIFYLMANNYTLEGARDFSFDLHNKFIERIPKKYKDLIAGELWETNIELMNEWKEFLDAKHFSEIID